MKDYMAVILTEKDILYIRVLFSEGVAKTFTISQFYDRFGFNAKIYPKEHPFVSAWCDATEKELFDEI